MSTSALSRSAQERLGHTRIEQQYRTIRVLIRCGTFLGCAYFASEAVKAFAGQSSALAVQFALTVLGDLRVTVAIALTGAATAWAVAERLLRLWKVEKMSARIRELETVIDPARSTSGLTPRGGTHPRDRG